MVFGKGQVRPISVTMSKTLLLLKASRNHHTFRLFVQTHAHISYATVNVSGVRSSTCTASQLVTNDQASSWSLLYHQSTLVAQPTISLLGRVVQPCRCHSIDLSGHVSSLAFIQPRLFAIGPVNLVTQHTLSKGDFRYSLCRLSQDAERAAYLPSQKRLLGRLRLRKMIGLHSS
jgi:hypothetical protein